MLFFLMQRNHKVAVIEIAEKTGDIIDMVDILSTQRIPLGARHINGSFDVLSLRKWWSGRGIPASRSGLERALETLQVPYAELLLVKCSGLSLSDQYWVTPCDAPQSWHAAEPCLVRAFSLHSRICAPPAIPRTAFYKSAGVLQMENEFC